MTDSSKTVVWSADYKPFGEATVTTSTVANNLRFPGQYFDAETGNNYNYFRDYNPSTGRYVEADPVGLSGGLNRWAYVGNNPVNAIDPDGLSAFYIVKRIGEWGLKILGRVSKDEAKRALKEGKDIMGSKTALKKFAKDKGKGKGKPICEKHGDGTSHWHTPDREGGHGFIISVIGGIITLFDYIDPVEIMYGNLARPEDDMIDWRVEQ